MNWVASADLPEPEGPATSTESPRGMPPASISSSPATPVDSRRSGGGFRSLRDEAVGARKDLKTLVGDAERVQPRHGLLAAQLHDLELADHRIALDALGEPEQAVGDSEDRVVPDLAFGVLPDEKRGRLPAGQVQRQALHEALQLDFAGGGRLRFADERAERVHEDKARGRFFDFGLDAVENGAEVILQDRVAQVDEADRGFHFAGVEEAELLLVAQHLHGRLAKDGEVQSRASRGKRWRT